MNNAHTPPNNSQKWHSLKEHLTDVAKLAQEFSSKFTCPELGYYAGLWHDLGKYNPRFQEYLKKCHQASLTNQPEPSDRVPHAIYGAELARNVCPPLFLLIAGHHSGLQTIDHTKNLIYQIVKPQDYQQIIRQAQLENITLNISSEVKVKIQTNLSGLNKVDQELFLRILFSCLVDADYLDTEEHFNPDLTRLRQNTTSLEKMWNLFQLDQENLMRANEQNTSIIQQIRSQSYNYALQSAEQTRTQGIFRLAIPTGGGKTRTSLAFALKHCLKHDLERIIIALPYTTIIEQTVKVYRQIFGENAVLEHHSALIPEENNEEDARFRSAQARLATENWNVPLVVTTTVQLFESLLSNRPSRCRKLHNLCKSVIILDEVQALPIELLAPILSVLKELNQRYGVTIVLCTATQPALEDSPYLAGFNEIIDIIPPQIAKRYFAQLARVNYHDEKATVTKSQLAERITHHEQALIILNTRKDAIELIQLLPEVKHIYHLSTLLCGRHRRKVLEEVRDRLQNNQPCLLISTQVVEAGVDLDFPVVYRAIAPMDRIIQSAGRCNREGKLLTRGDVFIIRLSDGGMPSGSYRHAYKTTETLLQEDWDWYNPDSYTRYFRRLYQTIDTDAHEIQKPRGCLNYPEVAQKFKMIPHQTFPVVIKHYPESQALVDIIKGRGLRSGDWQSLQPYLINLYQYDFHNARQQELLKPIAKNLWSWEGDYHPITGIGNSTGTIVKDPADLII